MNVLQPLAAGHRLFRELIGRIERAAELPEGDSRLEFRAALLVLLPALERHEAMEDKIFRPGRLSGAAARELLHEVERQHRSILELRAELMEALRDASRYPAAVLRARAGELAAGLKRHFELEEKRLWPLFVAARAAAADGALARKAEREAKLLGQAVAREREQVGDYLRGPR